MKHSIAGDRVDVFAMRGEDAWNCGAAPRRWPAAPGVGGSRRQSRLGLLQRDCAFIGLADSALGVISAPAPAASSTSPRTWERRNYGAREIRGHSARAGFG